MPYYQAERKRTYLELVRVHAETKKEANTKLEKNIGHILETSLESTVSLVTKTTVIDVNAEQRCRELFDADQDEDRKQNDNNNDLEYHHNDNTDKDNL